VIESQAVTVEHVQMQLDMLRQLDAKIRAVEPKPNAARTRAHVYSRHDALQSALGHA
jgi:hypothetical protein